MVSLLERFGISLENMGNQISSEPPTTLTGASSERELRDAIEYMIPRKSGIPLIRLGGPGDGGYMVPDDLEGVECCFSPGTNNFKRFEDELALKYSIKSHMCDFTSDVDFFQTPLIPGVQFFYKKWLEPGRRPDALNLDAWVSENSSTNSDLILQMDIEGAEYRNLISAENSTLSRFRIIILEIHDLPLLAQREFLNGVFLPMMRKITRDHVCVHAHANNCCGQTQLRAGLDVPGAIELTFLRRDRLRINSLPIAIPNEFDDLNGYRSPPLHLTGPWRSEADQVESRLNALEQSIGWITSRVVALSRYNSFLLNYAHLPRNIALNKLARQSSHSFYSTTDDAAGAANGIRTGKFAFHTEIEKNPWWMIDLGAPHRVDACLIFNRMDGAAVRADTLQLLTSSDGEQWTLLYNHHGARTFGGTSPYDGEAPLLVEFGGLVVRMVKLQLIGVTALHLDSVEIYGESI